MIPIGILAALDYQAPADVSDRLVEAIDEPGVLAGFSAVHNLPHIVAEWRVKSGYVYCPRRADGRDSTVEPMEETLEEEMRHCHITQTSRIGHTTGHHHDRDQDHVDVADMTTVH